MESNAAGLANANLKVSVLVGAAATGAPPEDEVEGMKCVTPLPPPPTPPLHTRPPKHPDSGDIRLELEAGKAEQLRAVR